MAINIEGKVDKLRPVFNPIVFYFDSTNKNEQNFNYVFEIFNSNTSQLINKYRLKGRPIDGYAVGDINNILKSEVGFFLNQDLNGISNANANKVDYNIILSEEYLKYWTFTDNNAIITGPYIGQTLLVGLSSSHTFVAGDSILVEQDPGFEQSNYNGVHTVLTAYTTSIVIDVDNISTQPNPGKISYANGQSTTFSAVTISSGYTAFNGAVSHKELMTYTSTTFNINSTTPARFLTNVPTNYNVKLENKMWLNMYSTAPLTNLENVVLTTRYGSYITNNNNTGSIQTFGIGPTNISQIENTSNPAGGLYWDNYIGPFQIGTYPIMKDVCWDWYQQGVVGGRVSLTGLTETIWEGAFAGHLVSYLDNNGNQAEAMIFDTPAINVVVLDLVPSAFTSNITGCLFQKTDYYIVKTAQVGTLLPTSKEIKFNIDYSKTRFGNIELLFIDRLGSFIPVNFELASTKSIAIQKTEYQTFLGNLTGDKWGFESTDRGRTTLNTNIIKSIDLISNFVTDEVGYYLQELFTSPVVYIKDDGKYYPVIVKTNGYTINTKLNKKNNQIKITVEMANNDVVQSF